MSAKGLVRKDLFCALRWIENGNAATIATSSTESQNLGHTLTKFVENRPTLAKNKEFQPTFAQRNETELAQKVNRSNK